MLIFKLPILCTRTLVRVVENPVDTSKIFFKNRPNPDIQNKNSQSAVLNIHSSALQIQKNCLSNYSCRREGLDFNSLYTTSYSFLIARAKQQANIMPTTWTNARPIPTPPMIAILLFNHSSNSSAQPAV